MTKLHLKFVQSFGGYHYFRRPGFPRIRLPGLVGSEAFMQAYQQALGSVPEPIGASKRSRAGSGRPLSPAITGRRRSGLTWPQPRKRCAARP